MVAVLSGCLGVVSRDPYSLCLTRGFVTRLGFSKRDGGF